VLDFSQNYFALFGLPMRYRVNGSLLADRYRALQGTLHPDRFAAAGEREKRLSLQASAHVNQAYQTLRDPLERARYLVSLHLDGSADEKESTQDMGFLMEQMELREALSGVKDRPDPHVAVGEVLDRLSGQAVALVQELEDLLDQPSAQDLEAARELVRKLQFVSKCRVEAEDLEAELDELS
jgi:molecular chaperone HscB